MKRLFLVIAMLVAALPPALSQTTATQQGQSDPAGQQGGDAEREVLKAQEEFLTAFAKRDVEALERVLADDFSLVSGSGAAFDKAGFVAAQKAAPPAGDEKITFDEVRVRLYGDAAVVTGRLTSRRQVPAVQNRFTNVWVKQGGRWRLAARQITMLAPQ